MLGELLSDMQVLVPGEIIIAGSSALIVYPLAIFQAARFPVIADVFAVVAAASDLAALESELLPLLAGEAVGLHSRQTGLPLLTACCSALEDAGGIHRPLRELPEAARGGVAAAWVRSSFAHLFVGSQSADDGGGDRYIVPAGAVLTRLITAGHSIEAILHHHQTGVDGRPASFPGWTIPQLAYWVRALDAAQRLQGAGEIEEMALAIGGVFGGDEGQAYMRDHVRSLRTTT